MKEIEEALFKKAVGYTAEEIEEEYCFKDGERQLIKQKIKQKYMPPDMTAINTLRDNDKEKTLFELTDKELEEEKQRLLLILKCEGEKNGSKKNQR